MQVLLVLCEHYGAYFNVDEDYHDHTLPWLTSQKGNFAVKNVEFIQTMRFLSYFTLVTHKHDPHKLYL